MLRMLSNAFVSLGRDTIDATRAYGRSDASVVALVLVFSILLSKNFLTRTEQGSGFAKEGNWHIPKGRRFSKLVVRRAPLLRLLLLLGRAADDASDDVGCVCSPPHPPRVSS